MDQALRGTNIRAEPNERARAAALVGILASAAIPAGLVLAAYSSKIDLKQAGAAVPVAFVLGIVAIALARRARRISDLTLGRVGGRTTARTAAILGGVGVYLAITCGLAVAFFGLLLLFE